jgi:hypothetical protein
MVVRDLLGPAGSEEEELDQREDHVFQRYLVGMLAPKASELPGQQMDELATEEDEETEDGATESGVPAGSTYFPSSMGISFVADGDSKEIVVESEWGHYLRIKSQNQVNKTGNPASVWKREPVKPASITLPLAEGSIGTIVPHKAHPQVVLQGRMRRTGHGWVVTIFLVNQQEERKRQHEPKDEVWVFQPKLRIRGVKNEPIFVQRKEAKADLSKMDPLTREEAETMAMLYRDHREFAVGHGVSIHATLPERWAERATAVETEWAPISEVPQQTPRSESDDSNLQGLTLDMKNLAEMPKPELIASLRRIEIAYGLWIEAEKVKIANPSEKLTEHEAAALRAMGGCDRAKQRIKAGINLLDKDSMAEEAFRFANHAMWQQRVHTIFSRKVRKKELKPEDGTASVDSPENRS